MNQIIATPSVVRTCVCGTRFVPPAAAPAATKCRRCYTAARQAAAKAAEDARAKRAEKEGMEAYEAAIREAVIAGRPPSWAEVRENGRQRVVQLPGRSMTFYLPKAA